MAATSRDTSIRIGLEAARAGDHQALGQVLESCRAYLLAVAERGLDADLAAKGGASDLVQETLLGAYRDIEAFQGRSRGELLAWLRRILRNNLADQRRQYRGTQKRRIGRELPLGEAAAGVGRDALPFDAETPGGCASRRERAEALDGRAGTDPRALSPGRGLAPVRPAHVRGDRRPAGAIARVGPEALVAGIDPPGPGTRTVA